MGHNYLIPCIYSICELLMTDLQKLICTAHFGRIQRFHRGLYTTEASFFYD